MPALPARTETCPDIATQPRKARANSGRERTAAAATSRGVRILKDETLTHQRLFVLQRGAVQIQQTFRVDEDSPAMLFKNLVAVARLAVETHGIGESGAAASLYSYTKTAPIGRDPLFFEQSADFQRRPLGQVDGRNIWAYRLCSHTKSYTVPSCRVTWQHAAPQPPWHQPPLPNQDLMRDLFRHRHLNPVLFLPVANSRLD